MLFEQKRKEPKTCLKIFHTNNMQTGLDKKWFLFQNTFSISYHLQLIQQICLTHVYQSTKYTLFIHVSS